MIDDTMAAQFLHMDEAERCEAETMVSRIDTREVETVLINALVDTLSAEELDALSDFYASPRQSLLEKLPAFIDRHTPAMMEIIMRAIFPAPAPQADDLA